MRHYLIGTALGVALGLGATAPAAAEASIYAEKDAGPYIGVEGGMWFPNQLKLELDRQRRLWRRLFGQPRCRL